MALGSDTVIVRNEYQNPKFHHTPVDEYLISAPAAHIINFDKKIIRKIYVPKNFYSKTMEEAFLNNGYRLLPADPKKAPKVLKDVKTILNSKNYSNFDSLHNSITKLNYVLARKIHDMNEGIKNNKKFDYAEELLEYKMRRKI